ncbi:hypothetical protein B0H12DRAFT_1140728, partial [Mycena haematopus]
MRTRDSVPEEEERDRLLRRGWGIEGYLYTGCSEFSKFTVYCNGVVERRNSAAPAGRPLQLSTSRRAFQQTESAAI